MTDSEKLDKIITEIADIKTHIAVQKYIREDHSKRILEVEKVAKKYNTDKAKVIGASTILAAIIAWITRHF